VEPLYLQISGDLTLDEDKKYVLKLRDLPADEKPREKLMKYGPQVLTLAELLAIVLNVGTKKEEILTMSRRLLKEYGDSAVIHQKDPKKVQEMLGIPLVKSCQLVACFEGVLQLLGRGGDLVRERDLELRTGERRRPPSAWPRTASPRDRIFRTVIS